MIKNIFSVRFIFIVVLAFFTVLLVSSCSSTSSSENPAISQTPPANDPNSTETDLTITTDQQVFVDNLLSDKLSESEAISRIQENGYASRVGERNGEQYMLTMDYRNDRLTLIIVNDVVTEAYWG